MKKTIYLRMFIFLIVIPFLLVTASADDEMILEETNCPIDFSGYSLDELLDIRDFLNEEIEQRGYTVYYDLTRGSTGENVSAVQDRLKELGYYEGIISGKYDTATQKAEKQFEKANGLTNDGDASREDQTILFSDNALKKEVVETAQPLATPKPTNNPELEEYISLDYSDCLRNPDQYYGQKVLLKGKVVQVMGSQKKGFTIRLATSNGYDDIYYITIDYPEFNILENDRLYVFAVMKGTKTYTSTFLKEITIPYATAQIVELR